MPVRIACPFFFFRRNAMSSNVCSCGKELTYDNIYRCRICEECFCKQCSLEHFGLVETNDTVKYKSVLKTFVWMFKKKFFRI